MEERLQRSFLIRVRLACLCAGHQHHPERVYLFPMRTIICPQALLNLTLPTVPPLLPVTLRLPGRPGLEKLTYLLY